VNSVDHAATCPERVMPGGRQLGNPADRGFRPPWPGHLVHR